MTTPGMPAPAEPFGAGHRSDDGSTDGADGGEHGGDYLVDQQQRAGWLSRLAAELTPRDRWLLHVLHEHRVLTGAQITALAFPSTPSTFANHIEAGRRLRRLCRWSVLDRFPLHRPDGSTVWHYVLGPAGAVVLAAAFELDPAALGYRRDRALAIAHSGGLAHQLGINQWVIDLITATRRQPFSSLDTWFAAARTAGWFGDHVRFDAYARYTDLRHRSREFFLLHEGDNTGHRSAGASNAGGLGGDRARGAGVAQFIADIAHDGPYSNLRATVRSDTVPLLIWLPTTQRESAVRAALHAALIRHGTEESVPVATAPADLLIGGGRFAAGRFVGPGDAVWLPLHTSPRRPATGRVGLTDLFEVWAPLPEPVVYHDPHALPTGEQDHRAAHDQPWLGLCHPWQDSGWRGEGALGVESVGLRLPAPVPDPLSWRRPPHHW